MRRQRQGPGAGRHRAHRRTRGAAAWLLAAVTWTSAAAAGPTGMETDDPAALERAGGTRGPWLSVGVLTGTTQLDAELADYQWITTPRMAWGAQALVGTGRFATGMRLWRTQTTQSIGDWGPAPTVRATSWELVGEGRLAEAWGTRLLATLGAGRLHLGYDPDRITIQPSGPGTEIVVDLLPVNEWIAGAGLALRRKVMARWTVGLAADHRIFGLDTAHRVGDAIVVGRETFGDWSARVELGWLYTRR